MTNRKLEHFAVLAAIAPLAAAHRRFEHVFCGPSGGRRKIAHNQHSGIDHSK